MLTLLNCYVNMALEQMVLLTSSCQHLVKNINLGTKMVTIMIYRLNPVID